MVLKALIQPQYTQPSTQIRTEKWFSLQDFCPDFCLSVSVRLSGESGYCSKGRFTTVCLCTGMWFVQHSLIERKSRKRFPFLQVLFTSLTSHAQKNHCVRTTHTHTRTRAKPKASSADTVSVHQGYNILHNGDSGLDLWYIWCSEKIKIGFFLQLWGVRRLMKQYWSLKWVHIVRH